MGTGGLQRNVSYGQQLMNWARQRSYDPRADVMSASYVPPRQSVTPQNSASASDAAGVVVGAIALLGLAALLSSGDKNSTSNTVEDQNAGKNPYRTCQVPYAAAVQNAPGSTYSTTWETRYRTGSGNECP